MYCSVALIIISQKTDLKYSSVTSPRTHQRAGLLHSICVGALYFARGRFHVYWEHVHQIRSYVWPTYRQRNSNAGLRVVLSLEVVSVNTAPSCIQVVSCSTVSKTVQEEYVWRQPQRTSLASCRPCFYSPFLQARTGWPLLTTACKQRCHNLPIRQVVLSFQLWELCNPCTYCLWFKHVLKKKTKNLSAVKKSNLKTKEKSSLFHRKPRRQTPKSHHFTCNHLILKLQFTLNQLRSMNHKFLAHGQFLVNRW